MNGLPAAVLFDMDGLLVDTEQVWFEVESGLVTELGGTWGPEDALALVGGPLERTLEHIVGSVPGPVSHDEVRVRLLGGMVTRLRQGPVHWMPGAHRLLEETSAAGVPRALVSSSLRVVVDGVLDTIGREHLPVTVSGDDVQRTKPHPDPYLLAAQMLGVDPTSCVALEDSATGATSARSAGCYTVAVPSLAVVPAGIAHHQVASLEELDLAALAALVGARA